MADAPGDRPGRAMPAEPAANNGSDAASVIAAWIDSQTDRQRAILATRLVGLGSRTLDDLGHEFGVSRQRVNQLENQLVAVVRALRDTDEVWGPVRWTIRELRQRLGGFAPLTDDALPPDPAGSLVTRTLLWLAGYRVTPAAVVSMGFALPETDELPLLGGGPAIDVMALAKDLHRRGVALHLLNPAMLAIDGVRRVDGRLVLWPRGLVDQSVTVLTVRGRPMTTDELDEVIGRDISTDSLRNRLLVDPRICRATRANVALRSWGRQEYTSIADLMCRRLQTGAMPLNSLAAELHRDFEISVESVHGFSRAPAFVVRAGQIMLRPADQPYVPAAPPGRVSGLFSIGTDVLVWRLQVGPDLFRGSGRAMPLQIAMFLALSPGRPSSPGQRAWRRPCQLVTTQLHRSEHRLTESAGEGLGRVRRCAAAGRVRPAAEFGRRPAGARPARGRDGAQRHSETDRSAARFGPRGAGRGRPRRHRPRRRRAAPAWRHRAGRSSRGSDRRGGLTTRFASRPSSGRIGDE